MIDVKQAKRLRKKTITSKSIEKIHNVLYTVICYIYIYMLYMLYMLNMLYMIYVLNI